MRHDYTVFAPGRAEVLGNHTDYNLGLVLAMAIEPGTTIEASPREDRTLVLESEGNGRWSGSLDDLTPVKISEPDWPNYIIGVAYGLIKRGFSLPGAEFRIRSTIPIGAGLSSSASLEIASGLAFQNLGGFDIESLELAKIGQEAEHDFAGAQCGLLDQIAVSMSREKTLTFIDCRSLEVRHLPFPEGWCFVVIHSGVRHALNDGAYNERRFCCEEAARSLGVASLREVTLAEMEAQKEELSALAYKRARHPVGETARVAQSVSCLAQGNLEGFGALLFDSHQSSREYFENSCEELDFLVDQARSHPDCLGARLSGGGFGGATLHLVKEKSASEYAREVGGAYEAKYGISPTILITRPGNGAQTRRTGTVKQS